MGIRGVGEAGLARTGLALWHRVGLQVGLDACAWVAGLAVAQVGRYDFALRHLHDTGFAVIATFAVALHFFVGTALHLYLGRYRFGGFEEVRGVLLSVGLTSAGALAADLLARPARPVPASVPVLGGAVALVLMFGVRYAWRLYDERHRRPSQDDAEPLIVFGAGEGGFGMISSMLLDPASPYYPVALLDDDPRKHNLQLRGVRVRGDRYAMADVARRAGARTLLIAVPTAGAALVRELSALAERAGLAVKVLPPVGDLIDGRVRVSDIRNLDLADLLGRRQIETDLAAIAGYLTGKRVLVTGAGGSIGSELCRQISHYAPAQLIMHDRDESALHAVQLSICGRALLDDPSIVLGDLRDVEHVASLFDRRRPEVVFHAAALKHLPLLERYPGESVKTNVWGTLTVLEAAATAGVERFVNISTDKAANPASVLGHSKRIAERLTSYVGSRAAGTFVSVRFGNVLGSRGSVLTAFSAQVAAGGPVTVTHPEVTRYFMTVSEAVELVVQAGALGRRGDALVLDMGEPVRIADVARRLVASSPRPVEVVYTGLRHGEKLHEELLGAGERDVRPRHPLISHVSVPMLDPLFVLQLDPWGPPDQILRELRFLGTGGDLSRSAEPPPYPGAADPRYGRRATDVPADGDLPAGWDLPANGHPRRDARRTG